MNLRKQALIAGASEGIGAAFAVELAARGYDLWLLARRIQPLQLLESQIAAVYPDCLIHLIQVDLAIEDACARIIDELKGTAVDFFVYNAALSFIGPFLSISIEGHLKLVDVNIRTLMKLTYSLGQGMCQRRSGQVVIMASLAGVQGSPYLTSYASSKSFDRIFGESLWYEWKEYNVQVLTCVAGATNTPGYTNTSPVIKGFIRPQVQTPAQVVRACFANLGKVPSFVSGGSNKLGFIVMNRLLPRKWAVSIMAQSTLSMYGDKIIKAD
ncbi:MAG: short-chain dehydrogenase [Bacteroidota bacterium]|nr:short-chain dehydrogenase [Bacteroidota bacterium]